MGNCLLVIYLIQYFLISTLGLGKLKIFVYRVLPLLPKNSSCMYFVYLICFRVCIVFYFGFVYVSLYRVFRVLIVQVVIFRK